MVLWYNSRVALYHGDILVDKGDEKVDNQKDHGDKINKQEQYSLGSELGRNWSEVEFSQKCRNKSSGNLAVKNSKGNDNIVIQRRLVVT